MSEVMFRQCELRRGAVQQTAWLPDAFAVVGKMLRLRKRSDTGCCIDYTEWDNGWTVIEVSSAVVPQSELHEHEHRFHRDAKEGKEDEVGFYYDFVFSLF